MTDAEDEAGSGDGDARDRVLVDAMCGSLATYLRMCGFDTAYALDRGVEADDALLALAREENRRLLTRDQDLGTRASDAVVLTSRDVCDQLTTVAEAGLDLTLPESPERCSACNGELEPVPSGEAPEYTPDPTERSVWRCPDCDQHFWRGSHWDDVAATLSSL